jgi:FAD-dependent urate hydroxylase
VNQPDCDIAISLFASVRSAREVKGEVEPALEDESTRRCDHVLLGPGYRVDITRYEFPAGALLERVDRVGG